MTDNDTVNLWDFLRRILNDLGLPPIRAGIPYPLAYAVGAVQEAAWTVLKMDGEPTITRYAAAELAENHSYSIARARSDLGYEPKILCEEGLRHFYEGVRNHLL